MAHRSQGQAPAQGQTRERWPKPVLHAGRGFGGEQAQASAGMPLEPAPVDTMPVVDSSESALKEVGYSGTDSRESLAPALEHAGTIPAEDPPSELHGSEREEDRAEEPVDRAFLEMHQRQRRELLMACARVQMFDFHGLAMSGWPENFALTQARRGRDQWVFVMTFVTALFLGGVVGLIPAWLGGPAFGALVLVGSLAVPGIRHWVTQRPSYSQLRMERQRLLRLAKRHIEYLEGTAGLAWQCQPLAEYCPALRQARFQSLYNLSRTGNLTRYVRTRAHVRLYLMFLLEAERAYEAVEVAFTEGQQALREQEPVPAA